MASAASAALVEGLEERPLNLEAVIGFNGEDLRHPRLAQARVLRPGTRPGRARRTRPACENAMASRRSSALRATGTRYAPPACARAVPGAVAPPSRRPPSDCHAPRTTLVRAQAGSPGASSSTRTGSM